VSEERIPPAELVLRAEPVETPMLYFTIWVDGPLARDLLQWNQEPELGVAGTNRKASEIKVAEYASTMLADEWRTNPHPIVFSETGWQEDGQQRLKALVKASLTDPDIRIPLTVCINAPDESRMVMDIGKRRTTSDFLKMAGQPNTVILAAALKMVYCYDNVPRSGPEAWKKTRWTPTLQAEALAAHPMLREGIKVAARSRHYLSVVPGSVLWYLIYRAMGDGGEKANWFFRGLEKGTNPDEIDVRYTFREGLARATMTHRDWDSGDFLGIGIKAFNNWAMGADNFLFGLRKNERFPKIITAAQALPLEKILTQAELKAVADAAKEIKTGDKADPAAAAQKVTRAADRLLHKPPPTPALFSTGTSK
jgi:hypothetical protein